jgi:hypothetical protein
MTTLPVLIDVGASTGGMVLGEQAPSGHGQSA